MIAEDAGNNDHRTDNAGEQYATFFVDGLFCGIEVLRVQEVLRPQQMTRVPLAPPVVVGLINLRGQIVTAVDVRRRLRLPDRDSSQAPMNMVVHSEDGAVSLLVDEIGDVIEVQPDSYERSPDNLTPDQKQMIKGIHKLENRLLLILDTDRILQFDPVSPAKTDGLKRDNSPA